MALKSDYPQHIDLVKKQLIEVAGILISNCFGSQSCQGIWQVKVHCGLEAQEKIFVQFDSDKELGHEVREKLAIIEMDSEQGQKICIMRIGDKDYTFHAKSIVTKNGQKESRDAFEGISKWCKVADIQSLIESIFKESKIVSLFKKILPIMK